MFCDLRGYTAFTETAEPEEVLDFLREYHGALGPLVAQFEGTLDQFSGDGIMVFFNDPVPIPDPAARAVNMAVAMREAAGTLIADWRERGRDLGFGAGIAQGYATLGQIGFSERSGYTAIGTVCNVAARLCAEAKDGQILLSQRVNVAAQGKRGNGTGWPARPQGPYPAGGGLQRATPGYPARSSGYRRGATKPLVSLHRSFDWLTSGWSQYARGWLDETDTPKGDWSGACLSNASFIVSCDL